MLLCKVERQVERAVKSATVSAVSFASTFKPDPVPEKEVKQFVPKDDSNVNTFQGFLMYDLYFFSYLI